MHNSKFKKSIASTTIKNSLSKTSFPRRSLVLFRGGERPAEVRRMDQQFTKLDKKKSNNNNNNENNLKSNIFCLCSILLIHINRGISHHVYSLHIQREECTGATTERWHGGGSSPLCSEFRPEDKRPGGQTSRRPPAVRPSVGSFLSGHPHLPTYLPTAHAHTCTTLSRGQTVWARTQSAVQSTWRTVPRNRRSGSGVQRPSVCSFSSSSSRVQNIYRYIRPEYHRH